MLLSYFYKNYLSFLLSFFAVKLYARNNIFKDLNYFMFYLLGYFLSFLLTSEIQRSCLKENYLKILINDSDDMYTETDIAVTVNCT